MKMARLLLATCLGATWAASASAAVLNLSVPGTVYFGNSHLSPGNFSDNWTVNISADAVVDGGLLNIALVGNSLQGDIDFSSVTLGSYAFTHTVSESAANGWLDVFTLSPTAFAAGSYLFNVSGHSAGYGSYAGVLNAAVPEPASWTMMLGGFGMLGSMMRRRKVQVTYA